MKTTLMIPDQLFRELKRRAAERNQTLSAVVAETLRCGLSAGETASAAPLLPTFRLGRPKVDLADRDALFRAMEDI